MASAHIVLQWYHILIRSVSLLILLKPLFKKLLKYMLLYMINILEALITHKGVLDSSFIQLLQTGSAIGMFKSLTIVL